MYVPSDVGAWLRHLLADHPELDTVVEYLSAGHRRALRPSTLSSQWNLLRRLHRDVGDLMAVPEREVRRWWNRLSVAGVAPASQRTYLAHMRGFYKWALIEDLRVDDPCRRIDAPRITRRLPRPVDPDRIGGLVDDLAGDDWVIVALATYCGLRCMEIAAVYPRDLRTDELGRDLLVVTGKGGHERMVALPAALATELRGRDPNEPAIQSRHHAAYTSGGMSARLGRILDDHDIAGTAHQLRHTFATATYQATRDLLGTGRALGHQSPNSTAIYADADPSAQRDAVEAAWRRLGADNEQEATDASDG